MKINVAGDILFERTKIDIAGRRLRLALVFPCCLYRPDRARRRRMPQERRGPVLCLLLGDRNRQREVHWPRSFVPLDVAVEHVDAVLVVDRDAGDLA